MEVLSDSLGYMKKMSKRKSSPYSPPLFYLVQLKTMHLHEFPTNFIFLTETDDYMKVVTR